MVGHEAVDFLGHRSHEAASASLDVGEGDPELRGGERAGERRVCVAANDDPLGPLYEEHRSAGTLKSETEISFADVHGQYRFAHKHAAIRDGAEEEFLLRAFRRDYEVNGPSIIRMVRTTLQGWKKHKHNPDARVRARFAREARELATVYAGAVWAARRYFKQDQALAARMDAIQQDLYAEFGLKARLLASLAGRFILSRLRREDRRLAAGWTYEPPTFYEVKQRIAASCQL
jgi:hypothetical protein